MNAIIETASNTLITGCKNTIIPNSVTSIGLSAFEGCSGLTSVVIPNSVTSIGREAFWCCYNLQSITIPSSVTNIGKEAFHGCSSPTSITVEKGNICYDSRNDCNAIIETKSNKLIFGCKNTIIPNSVTSIDDYAFFSCYRLTSITIPNSVTSIGYHAFENCFGMKSVYIPNSVTNIGNGAFIYCRGLTSITCEANTPPTISLYGACFVDVNKSIPVYVPANSVAQYKVANEWKDFVNLQAISTTYALIDGESYNNNSQIEGYDISYTRNFTNTKWQALYIPFSMSYDDWKNDFDIAYINGIRQYDMNDDGAIDETIMDVIKIKHGSLIPNTPYLIRAKTTGEKTITVNNATLYKAEENSIDCRTTIAEYTFTGTYSTIPASTLIANNYYAMGDGSLVITDGTSDLKPYRWYMKIDARSPMYNVSLDAKTITINVIGDEETTGVSQLQITNDELSIYDLNGRRVNEKSLKAGFYIKNGKKVIIK